MGELAQTSIRCPRCGVHLAYTDGRRLRLTSCTIVAPVTLHCSDRTCGGYRRWFPAPPGTANGTR